jgi:UDP-2,4-diacetamido-2,4,6-trideoxy-beta-L-altropyranose hydrolase
LVEQKLLFRVDANFDTGTGHFFRCLALAQAVRARGFDSIFLGEILGTYLNNLLKSNGFKYLDLPGKSTNINGDAEETVQIIQSENILTLILDEKTFDIEWERLVRPHVQILAVIDDRPTRKHDVDILISPNLYKAEEKPFEGLVPIECEIFLGPTSLPLRSEFRNIRANKELSTSVTRVGSFFGGTDPGNQSGLILDLAALPQFSNIEFRVITGPLNPLKKELLLRGKDLQNVKIVTSVTDMAKFWDEVDVAFGSYGISTWERCALGVPSITSIQNDEQISDAEILESLGAVLNIGKLGAANIENYFNSLEKLVSDRELRLKISKNSSLVMHASGKSKTRLLNMLTGSMS